MSSLLAAAAIALCTGSAFKSESTSVRRCERSGPMTTARMRRKCTRNRRCSLRTPRSRSAWPLVASRIETGGANCTIVSRPLSSSASRRRKRPTTTQFSENSTLNQPDSRSGARPTKIDTGTSRTSVAASAPTAAASRLRVSERVGCGRRPNARGRRDSATIALRRLIGSFSAIAYGEGRPASRQACSRISASERP